MKILIVSHGYPPLGVAGVERLSSQVAAELTARGHRVSVLTRQPSEHPTTLTLRRENRGGIPVDVIVGAGSTFGLFPGHEPALEGIFERILIEHEPDVVLATHLLHHSPGYVAVAHRWKTPVVIELHDFFMLCPRVHLQRRSGELCDGPEGGSACAVHCFADQADAGLRWALRSRSFAEALSEADEVVAPSQYVVDSFAALRGPERPIRIVENAVTQMGPVLREEGTPEAPLRIASIGVTVEHKGFQVVIEALRLARLQNASYTVFGVSLPPFSRHLQAVADQVEGLDFRLAGGFEPEHLPVLLAESDVVVVPSIVPETYSIVAREAFACGVPVIASRIGALPDAIRPGDNGWLFDPGDALGLAELLSRLDEDRSLLRRAAAGIRPDDVVSVATRTDAIESLLHDVVSRPPPIGETSGARELELMREALAAADQRAKA